MHDFKLDLDVSHVGKGRFRVGRGRMRSGKGSGGCRMVSSADKGCNGCRVLIQVLGEEF